MHRNTVARSAPSVRVLVACVVACFTAACGGDLPGPTTPEPGPPPPLFPGGAWRGEVQITSAVSFVYWNTVELPPSDDLLSVPLCPFGLGPAPVRVSRLSFAEPSASVLCEPALLASCDAMTLIYEDVSGQVDFFSRRLVMTGTGVAKGCGRSDPFTMRFDGAPLQ